MIQKEEIIQIINEHISELVGDTAVSCQLNAAIGNHIHKNYVTRDEYNKLKAQVDRLNELVGEIPVAVQINAALSR